MPMCVHGAISYVFVFRAYPDVDHMAPLAWRLLEEGEQVHGVISPGYDPRGDYRLRFLSTYPGFRLHEVRPLAADAGRLGRGLAAARCLMRTSLPGALLFLARNHVQLVAVEWGYGLPAGYDRLRSPQGVIAVARSFARSVVRVRDPYQARTSMIVAARLLGRPVVCLPHGLNIKLGRGGVNGELLPGSYDWHDRNRFAAYVLNTEHQRRWYVERAAGDPSVMQTWGSVRWAPEWFERNRQLTPKFTWPAEESSDGGPSGRPLRVVFMVPKWRNRVNKDATLELVARLAKMRGIALAVKGHPRPADGSADPLRKDPRIDWTRVHDATAVDSVALIAAADVVIDVGSSIGIEAVMQHTVLINPCYLHEMRTFFDVIPDSCVVARSADEVGDYLRRHMQGAAHQVGEVARRELMRCAVYGSQPESYDVLSAYVERVRALAGER
jgi:hypothetical protein